MANKIDAGSLLEDFKSEAGTHIEKIESAFLDTDALAANPALMDGVFRAAHSLKGTAGFFSLHKIVALAHELESVFSRIKDGSLALDDNIADIALQSTDCLKELVNDINSPESVDTDGVLNLLKGYSDRQPPESFDTIPMPFNLKSPENENILQSAAKRGHKAYYLKANFDRSLGRYYSHPQALIDDILSIGQIAEAMIDGKALDVSDSGHLAASIAVTLTEGKASALELLVTSVLEPELFLIAVELDKRFVHPIAKEAILGQESGAKGPQSVPTGGANVTPVQPPKQETGFSIRLDVSVVNGLMDLANEMILTRNQLLACAPAYMESAALTPVLHDMSRLTSEIQERVMRTRMQPVSAVFGKFPRIIRDTAKSLNKDIQINISGGDVPLDKYLLDALSDPITQLVKNSADHGIEKPERRAALGKPPKGAITLSASARDGLAVIEVSDDGAGIDTEALKRKSLERGLASKEQLAAMTRNGLLNLIFEPGLSTAKQVTNLSGRGVGMDIVKTNIEKLGGSIEMESELGKGTVTRLKMPLTLSAVRTLIVEINSIRYAVPEASVERIVRVSAAAPQRLELDGGSLTLCLDGWRVPAVTMEGIDAGAKGIAPPDASEVLERIRRCRVSKFLVLKAGGKNFALLISDALETEETLVKPLPVYLRNCRCYSSTAVLGNGSAAMVLDAGGIMSLMGIEGAEKPDKNALAGKNGEADKDLRQVIIYRCSAGYFAADADKVSRIERIAPEDIQDTEGGHFASVAGKNLRVIEPKGFPGGAVPKSGFGKSSLYLLTLREGTSGLLAEKVIDRTEAAFKLEEPSSGGGYVSGRGVYNEKALILLNTDEIVSSAGQGGCLLSGC